MCAVFLLQFKTALKNKPFQAAADWGESYWNLKWKIEIDANEEIISFIYYFSCTPEYESFSTRLYSTIQLLRIQENFRCVVAADISLQSRPIENDTKILFGSTNGFELRQKYFVFFI